MDNLYFPLQLQENIYFPIYLYQMTIKTLQQILQPI